MVANILEESIAASIFYPRDGSVSCAEMWVIMYQITHYHIPETKIMKFTTIWTSDLIQLINLSIVGWWDCSKRLTYLQHVVCWQWQLYEAVQNFNLTCRYRQPSLPTYLQTIYTRIWGFSIGYSVYSIIWVMRPCTLGTNLLEEPAVHLQQGIMQHSVHCPEMKTVIISELQYKLCMVSK